MSYTRARRVSCIFFLWWFFFQVPERKRYDSCNARLFRLIFFWILTAVDPAVIHGYTEFYGYLHRMQRIFFFFFSDADFI